MKHNGHWPWRKEELRHRCPGRGKKKAGFSKTETVKLPYDPKNPESSNKEFLRIVCLRCGTAFKKIPGNEGKVDKRLSSRLRGNPSDEQLEEEVT